MRARRIASPLLAAVAGACVVVALLTAYARVALLDSGQFSDRAVAALDRGAVRDVVAARITDEAVLRANRDLVAVRPVIQTAASAIVGSSAFQALFRAAVRDLHRTAFARHRDTVTLTVADVGVLLSGALRGLDPKVARELPPGFSAKLSAGREALDAVDLTRASDAVHGLALIFAVLAALLLAGTIAVAPDRRRAVVHAGIAVAVAGALVVVVWQVARSQVSGRFSVPEEAAAARAVWDAFLGDLRTWALVVLGAGTVVAAAAASLLRPLDVRGPLRRGWDLVTRVPRRPPARAARAGALIAAGALIVAERAWVLDLALILAGVFVLYEGVAELLRLVAAPPRAAVPAPASARPSRRPALVAGGSAVLLVGVLVAVLLATGGTSSAGTAAIRACNGHPQLCDRPLDDVVFAGTHNAMSAQTNPGWLFAQQERGLRAQLDDGVRALLIDAHYGERVGARVRTDLDARQERAQLVRRIGEPAVAAALRIRDRLVGGTPGPRTTWLCHGMCELGALDMTAALREVRDFLAAHPDEVLLIVVQDEGVTPADVAKAFDASGVRPFVYTGRVGPPWPTLRQMIASGGRVLVMAENRGGGRRVPWYHDAYRVMQETPYHFTKPAQLSCARNRGPRDASLFLLNHWIDTTPAPRPSNAARVNAYGPLLARARRCQRERGLLPNVIAVDFYRTGDLFRVVDTLNRIPSPA